MFFTIESPLLRSSRSYSTNNVFTGSMVISRKASIRCPDSTPLEYYLWSFLVIKVRKIKPTNHTYRQYHINCEWICINSIRRTGFTGSLKWLKGQEMKGGISSSTWNKSELKSHIQTLYASIYEVLFIFIHFEVYSSSFLEDKFETPCTRRGLRCFQNV